jgi:hypothetical protein
MPNGPSAQSAIWKSAFLIVKLEFLVSNCIRCVSRTVLRHPESQRKKSENNVCIRDIYCEEGTRSSMGTAALVKYGVRSPKFIWAPCAQLYTLVEIPQLSPLPPHLDSYTRSLLVSQDKRHLFVTPFTAALFFSVADDDFSYVLSLMVGGRQLQE